MFSFTRAAAYAAAFVTMAASAAFADPSLAWDLEAAPITSSYIDHASAELDGSSLAAGLQGPARLSQDVDFSTPVATHAVASVTESPVDPEAMGEDRPLGELIADYASTTAGSDELKCLASAVYFESKGEPLEGQLAVAEVILNRVESPKFPDTICGVVKQRSQFSFVHGGHIPSAPTSSHAWRTAVAIALIAKNDLADSAVSTALFFHATYVRPGWRGLTRMASVGNHIFYR